MNGRMDYFYEKIDLAEFPLEKSCLTKSENRYKSQVRDEEKTT